jgi:hypothetical protein
LIVRSRVSSTPITVPIARKMPPFHTFPPGARPLPTLSTSNFSPHQRTIALQTPKRILGTASSLDPSSDTATTTNDETKAPLNPLATGIAGFYDASTGLWENMWGDHLHHGYYPRGSPPKSNRQAQIDMIEEVLLWAGVNNVHRALDVGCGLGGSARHLARKFACEAEGVTLSPYQAKRGNELSKAQGLG